MRTGGVPAILLVVLGSLLTQAAGGGDLYWEGEDDASNEFLQVNKEDTGIRSHLRRLRNINFFDFFSTPTTSEAPPDNYETLTEDPVDDTIPDGNDDLDNDGSGLPEKSEPEQREKTLRVTFVVMEPYKVEYSNRDSAEFREFSRSLAEAVNQLYELLPGTQRASLVRIQSRLSDEFSCKVTLDIITTGFDDTTRITKDLQDHIRNRRKLGSYTVSDADFSAKVDPGSTLDTCASDEFLCDGDRCVAGNARCNGFYDCTDETDEAGCADDNDTYEAKQEQTTYTPGTGDNYEQTYEETESRPKCDSPIPCSSSSVTICPNQRCDGTADCPLGEDEQNCTPEYDPDSSIRGDIPPETTPRAEEPETTLAAITPSSTLPPITCHEDELRCDETRCIPMSKRCDGASDCYDNTDEAGCKSCGEDDFRCDDGLCIESSLRCNKVADCRNEEDEKNCTCNSDEFRCVSDGSCIEMRRKCDGTIHCPDNSDEQDCACSSDQWQCDHGNCIKRSKRCDGRVDCPTDRSDERNCVATGYFKCRTGKLIPEHLRCNRHYDCPPGDYSDEKNCPCGEGDYKCDNGYCIPASKHCDRTHDCQDGSDERNCTYGTVCMAYQYKCSNGQCVPAESWCNGTKECDDGTDEMNCPCKRDQFQCRDGSCINLVLRCNGHRDCSNGDDEHNCGEPQCPADSFKCNPDSLVACAKKCDGQSECSNGEDEDDCNDCSHFCDNMCLEDSLICNGASDCADGSDELNCYQCDGRDDFKCANNECISANLRCNDEQDCSDYSDELDCNSTLIPLPHGCGDNEFQCRDGVCINNLFVCDGHPDCNDNFDELNCPWYMMRPSRSPAERTPCKQSEFTCYNGRCIPHNRRCDNYYDCTDFSDEQNCDISECSNADFQCTSGSCIPSSTYCDGHRDCPDGSDENNCTNSYSTESSYLAPATNVPIQTTTHESGLYESSSKQTNRENTPGYNPYINGPSNRESYGSTSRPENQYPFGLPERDQDESTEPYVSSENEPGRYPSESSSNAPGRYPYGSSNNAPGGGSYGESGNEPGRYPYGSPNNAPGGGSYGESGNEPGRYPSESSSNAPGRYPYGSPNNAPGGGSYGESGNEPGRYPSESSSNAPGRYPYGSPNNAPGGGSYGESGNEPGRYPSESSSNAPGRYPYGSPNNAPGGGSYGESGNEPGRYPSESSSNAPSGGSYGESGNEPGRYPYGSPNNAPGGGSYGESGNEPGRYPSESSSNAPGRYPYGSPNNAPGGGSYGESGNEQGRYPSESSSNAPGRYPYGSPNNAPGGGSYGESGNEQGRYPSESSSNAPGRYPYGSSNNAPGGGSYGESENEPGRYPSGSSENYPYAFGTEVPEPDNEIGNNGGNGGQNGQRPDGTNTGSGPRYGERGYPYGSESGGTNYGVCNEFEWRCENGPCIASYRRCDGRIDCPQDLSDEFDCPPGSPIALKLKTYPEDQSIRYVQFGGDVVFQCRDEGLQRAPVRWIREGGRPLKPGSIDRNGRLEMYQVSVSDAGVYICQTPRYLSYPGSEVRVTLNVENARVTQKPNTVCKPNEATCNNGQCIPKSAVCNGAYDCADRSDEESCSSMCEPNEYQCANRKCILKSWLCDSDDDCGDGSDEQECPSDPGHPCLPSEFACLNNSQCVPKSFHCDSQDDCFDRSDETGCAPIHVTVPPRPSNLKLNPGDTLTLTCEAVGIPVPLISWRLNWGHVANKCSSTSINGVGVLTCPNMQAEDSGAYSCEAINNKGTTFASPDSIVFVNKTVCPSGYFNSEARSPSECIRCFCFGESNQCKSADLFTYNMPTPLGEGGTRMLEVKISNSGDMDIDVASGNEDQFYYQALRNGASVTKLRKYEVNRDWAVTHPYVTLPETYYGNQLTSYGGRIKYMLEPHSSRYNGENNIPTIIIKGKYERLIHISRKNDMKNIEIEARLTPEHWQKASRGGLVPASREDIMMALDNVQQILLRADLNGFGVNITDFVMESAHHTDVGLGAASLVEECKCPPGYEGLSCQKCASGYVRESAGPWLGRCVRPTCPPGTYGDPASGYACEPCPCPLTNRENQFSRTCSLGSDGTVACDCYSGYEGKNCEYCTPGYVGNPLLFGDTCKPAPTDNCNKIGTSQVRLPDDCVCKDNVQGRYCDQCKNDSFYLSQDFRHGCALCFCSGVSQQCMSGNLRRQITTIQFNVPTIVNQVKVYNSAPSGPAGAVRYNAPIDTGLKPELVRGQIMLRDIDRSRPSIYYWSLPSTFAGDKVTSYGGFLRYTLVNSPTRGSNPTINAADVQLISENHLTFHYLGNFKPSNDGILNASVQFLEGGWRRSDGKEVSREHFLLALADVKTILIKASYELNGQLSTPIVASIETAEPSGNGPSALHVEQCVCPVGYVGTSCEDCAPGFTRSASGLYLEHCGLCECNGHSKMCHPETGVCTDCGDNTAGSHCEECKPGFERDSYGNCVEYRTSTYQPCRCDSRGEATPCDGSGRCNCKQNVEGETCDVCRSDTFGLDANNPLGCISCYCSGVTNECHEGSHYTRIPMAAPIFGDNYGGYTLMDLNAEEVINEQFVPVPDKSELMYVFSFPATTELFWSLPVFPGNRVLSYGGTLSLKQEFEGNEYSTVSEPGTDVVLVGDDTSLYWTNPNLLRSGEPMYYQVPLTENGWYTLNTNIPASRNNFMGVLKNLRRVLVRATVARNILSTAIADVSMDTATESYDPESPVAKGVEICMCPTGYTGTSCETCSSGYYKDQHYCRQCPCNGHDCQLDNYGQVLCNCRAPFTGPDCTTYGLVMELHPTIHDDGSKDSLFRRVTFTCKYRAPEPLTIMFYNEGREVWPPKPYNESWHHKDGWHGMHVWHTIWDTRRQGEIYECHTVTERGFTLGVLTTSLPEPGDREPHPNTSPRPPLPTTTVTVKIIGERLVIREVGSSVNFTCKVQSQLTSNPLPISWSKVDGVLPRERTQIDSGVLLITNLQTSDSGIYACQISDGVSIIKDWATLRVPGNEMTEPVVSIQPVINEYYEGDRVEMECTATGNPTPTISWQRASRRPLPISVETFDGMFIIENALEEDSGEYRCIGSNPLGSVYRTAVITIRARPSWPAREKLTIQPTSATVAEGQSTRVVCTGTPEVPAGSIEWNRQDGSAFLANVRSENGVLYIEYARMENQGVYVCQTSSSGIAQVPILVTVIAVGTPPPSENPNITVSVDKILTIPTGSTGTVDCSPHGNPLPLIKWSKHSGSFGRGTSQRDYTLIITNAQDDDQGYYLCEGTVSGQVVASTYVFVKIEKRVSPRVEIFPQGEQAVALGSQYELQCRVLEGIPEPDIMWDRAGGRPLSTSTHIQPQNILRFDKVDVNDEGEYTCTATNLAGTQSASSVLKVRSPPVITVRPRDFLQPVRGDSVTVECRASGYPEPMVSIKSNSNLRELVPPTPSIAVLYIPSVSDRDDDDYTCIATNAASTVQDQFAIRVSRGDGGFGGEEGSGEDDIGPGNIPYNPDEQPRSLEGYEGQSEIVIFCNGSEEYEPRWERYDGQPLQRNAFQDGARLIIRNVSKSDSGQYVCSLMNIITGEINEAAYTTLSIIRGPIIILKPKTRTVQPGQSPTVECIVEGDDIMDVSWRPVGRALSSRVETRGSLLIFHQIEFEDAGKYECFARNRLHNASATVEVIVSEDSGATTESHDNEQFAHAGSTVHLSCNMTQPNLKIRWTKDGRSLPRSVKQKNDGSLLIKQVQKSDRGLYRCHVQDHYGRQTSNYINLHIEGIECSDTEFRCYDDSGCIDEDLLCDSFQDCKDNSDEENCLIRYRRFMDISDRNISVDGIREQLPALVAIDQTRRQYRIGQNVEVLCKASNRNTNVKWERLNTNEFVESITYGDGAMLRIQGVQEPDAGVYRCTGMDRNGHSSYEDFNLEVEPGTNGGYPDNQNDPAAEYAARLRSPIDLPCSHNLELPVSIEWRKEFSSLPADVRTNEPILHLDSVTENDAGTYVCRISNRRVVIETKAILRVVGVVPRFNGDTSWLSLPTLKDAYRQFDIEVSFRPSDGNGLILYNSQNQGSSGDYLALWLEDGVPQFILDTGTGPVTVRGDQPLQLNIWHTIRVSRTNTNKVTMDVDNAGPFTVESSELWAILDLSQPLYIGGVPDYNQLPSQLTTSGFAGCVSLLILGRIEKNIMIDSIEQYAVDECISCASNSCLNNGVCQEAPNERGFKCICAAGYAGLNCDRIGEACRDGLCGPGKCIDAVDGYKCACPVTHNGRNCEQKQYIEYPAFTGSTYLAFNQPTTSRYMNMSMNVKATSPVTDGIIMYCAESSRGYGGFTALVVHDGRLEFRYDPGEGSTPVVLTSNRTLTANDWTNVHILRSANIVSMKIKFVENYEQRLDANNKGLTFNIPMFVGGVDESIVLNNNTGVTGGFNGCIKKVVIDGKAVDIVNSSIQSANVQECINYDRGDIPEVESVCSQCRNGGGCLPDSNVCSCPNGFMGTYCEQRINIYLPRQIPSDPCAAHNPCLNGGSCKPNLTTRMNYTCDCRLGFAGAICQMHLKLFQSVGFNGNGYVELPSQLLRYDSLDREPALIALAMHTNKDGVLLYQREALVSPNYGDYIMLRIENGFVVLDWDVGGGKTTISVDTVYVNDGERHQIIAKLFGDGHASLSVDGSQRTGTSAGISNLMNADSNIYIGGIPDSINVENYPGLSGCIEHVELMDHNRGLNLGNIAVTGRNTQRCRESNRV